MKEIGNKHDRAFTIVPFSSLKPSGKGRVKSESWMVHDDGFVGENNNFTPVRGKVEFSVNAVQGLIRRARLVNAVEGVA